MRTAFRLLRQALALRKCCACAAPSSTPSRCALQPIARMNPVDPKQCTCQPHLLSSCAVMLVECRGIVSCAAATTRHQHAGVCTMSFVMHICCMLSCGNATGIHVKVMARYASASSLRCRFDSQTHELSFLAAMRLLDFGSGYNHLLAAHDAKSARDAVQVRHRFEHVLYSDFLEPSSAASPGTAHLFASLRACPACITFRLRWRGDNSTSATCCDMSKARPNT